jgi:hypothetical protein
METKTIRVDSKILSAINEDASKKNLSDNALINLILLKYVISDRYLENFPIIVVVQEMLNLFLEKITYDEVKQIGNQIGSKTPKSIFLMKGIADASLETVIWYFRNNHEKYARWFSLNHHISKKANILHMRHRLGRKWSAFLSGYMKGFFQSLLDIEVDIEESDSYVTITV